MNFPLYVYYELLIRLSATEHEFGDFVSISGNDDLGILRTTHGTIAVSKELIERQFKDPGLITQAELVSLASTFKANAF